MKMKESQFIQRQVEGKGVKFLGEVFFDSKLEETIGRVNRLLETRFSKELGEIVTKNMIGRVILTSLLVLHFSSILVALGNRSVS